MVLISSTSHRKNGVFLLELEDKLVLPLNPFVFREFCDDFYLLTNYILEIGIAIDKPSN